jgi:mannose-6-phosphate isomerase-like protein (cupin superfamily)
MSYVLSGGKAKIEDDEGVREVEVRTGSLLSSPPIPWHELTNIGETPLIYPSVEKKYEPLPNRGAGRKQVVAASK